jgi:hypothetical protein
VIVFLVWVPVANAWSWPVHGKVLAPFSYDEAHPYHAGQHRGIDIAAGATGDPVVAPEGGTVSFAGFVPTSGESLTIETTDGYSVTLTHLGSLGVAVGAVVSEGDVVATVGPSGTPEQSAPYVHLGIRLTDDPLGYRDPLGLLPAVEPTPNPPTPTPTPTPVPVPVPVPVRAPVHAVPGAGHGRGGGLVIKDPASAPPAAAAPVEPAHTARPTSKPIAKPSPAPAARTLRTDLPQFRLLLGDPFLPGARIVSSPLAHAFKTEPLMLSIAPGIVAVLLALITASSRRRRPDVVPAEVIEFRKELPLRRAA